MESDVTTYNIREFKAKLSEILRKLEGHPPRTCLRLYIPYRRPPPRESPSHD